MTSRHVLFSEGMTAAQIAEIVGTERKAWWPPFIYFEKERWRLTDHDYHDDSPILPDFAELAFIGAAVRELAKRKGCGVFEGADNTGTLFVIDAKLDRPATGRSLLAALVAALNEREAR